MKRLLQIPLASAAVLAGSLLSQVLAAESGVTLYRDRNLKGASQTFYDDVPDLRYAAFGSRQPQSISVAPGCLAILFQQPFYEGRSHVLLEDHKNLAQTPLGSGAAASMRVACDATSATPDAWKAGRRDSRGVTLFRGNDRKGPSEVFGKDVPDLDRVRFGARMARSLALAPGCSATLYELPDYKGRSREYTADEGRMGDAANRASSLRLRCAPQPATAAAPLAPVVASPLPPPLLTAVPAGRRLGVTLYRDRKMKGKNETIYEDVPDLSRHPIGAHAASAIWVPRGCEATLFELPHFKGRSANFRDSNPNLRTTRLGDRSASSIRVACLQP